MPTSAEVFFFIRARGAVGVATLAENIITIQALRLILNGPNTYDQIGTVDPMLCFTACFVRYLRSPYELRLSTRLSSPFSLKSPAVGREVVRGSSSS